MIKIAFYCFIACFVSLTHALYPSSSDVIELTPSNFNKLVINSDEVWVVEFYAPWCGHCKSLVPEYTKAASALKGVVKVGSVNADEHKSLGGQYGVRGFPTIKIFGSNKNKPDDFNGQRAAQSIVEAALKAAKDKVEGQMGGGKKKSSSSSKDDVIELTDDNFDKLVLKSDDIWLVEFYAPWCGHCKNLAPHWAQAASELKGKVKLGALDATIHTSKASQYGIQGFPTIKYFPAGPKTSSSAEEYDGGRTAGDIVTWASNKAAENIPAPEIKQLTGEDVMKSNCVDHPLCVVAILPNILDCQSECRNGYLKTLAALGDKYKKKMWGWIWSEAGAQPEVEDALGLGGFGYPAMSVFSPKKLKYSVLRGSFGNDGINEYLRDLSYGRGSTFPVKGATIPAVQSITPWDGKDGQLEIEEEIDLSDVDLDDLSKDEL
ncbi:protein disulfide-isomerase A6 homolog [Daphnia pulex]|uniref:protein disulfide-isomerase A6 homolog n=1 Tax=Daphnia pulex TaxID=6669 RepID=UPI001EDD12EF|nr:protein disulfide-isomerase A6 homolog [Daphnia pulex]